jgi:hypothetical protein
MLVNPGIEVINHVEANVGPLDGLNVNGILKEAGIGIGCNRIHIGPYSKLTVHMLMTVHEKRVGSKQQ